MNLNPLWTEKSYRQFSPSLSFRLGKIDRQVKEELNLYVDAWLGQILAVSKAQDAYCPHELERMDSFGNSKLAVIVLGRWTNPRAKTFLKYIINHFQPYSMIVIDSSGKVVNLNLWCFGYEYWYVLPNSIRLVH